MRKNKGSQKKAKRDIKKTVGVYKILLHGKHPRNGTSKWFCFCLFLFCILTLCKMEEWQFNENI